MSRHGSDTIGVIPAPASAPGAGLERFDGRPRRRTSGDVRNPPESKEILQSFLN